MKFDDVVKRCGFGWQQKVVFLLVLLPTLFCSYHSLSWTFTAPSAVHRCRTEEEFGLTPRQLRFSINDSRLVCLKHDDDADCIAYESCLYDGKDECPFGHVYADYSRYTAVERWSLVCSRHVLKPVVQSAYYLGQFLGSLFFGFLSDRYGRKTGLILAMIVQLVAGGGMSIAPTWWLFALFRSLAGFAHPGIFMTSIILGMELIPPSKRSNASVCAGILFSIGQIILGLVAYGVHDYMYLQLILAVPSVIFVIYFFVVPESARWLVSQKRYPEADKILKKIASKNKKDIPDKWWEDLELDGEATGQPKKQKNFLDLFKTPKIRCRTLVMLSVWPIVSMAYYGMSMKPDLLGSDMYLNFIIGGLTEIPASIFMFATVNRLGRKPLLIGGLTLAGITLFTNLFVTENTPQIIPTIQFLLSKSCMTLVYSTIYTMTPELFPTEIRNMAVGACSMAARFGASGASFMVMFLVEIYGAAVITIPFGILVILAAVLVFFTLPETAGTTLPETIIELERKRQGNVQKVDDQAVPLTAQIDLTSDEGTNTAVPIPNELNPSDADGTSTAGPTEQTNLIEENGTTTAKSIDDADTKTK